jgi:hypothetical protein
MYIVGCLYSILILQYTHTMRFFLCELFLILSSCIGLYAKLGKVAAAKGGKRFSTVPSGDEITGIVMGPTTTTTTTTTDSSDATTASTLAAILGSPEDLEQVQYENPLRRARMALETALLLFPLEAQQDTIGIGSAQLSLAYVYLECREFKKVLELTNSVLEHLISTTTAATVAEGAAAPATQVDLNHWQRQHATARMYAAEASCALGDAKKAMLFLVGDSKSNNNNAAKDNNDALDRLASALGGVTVQAASACVSSGKPKARLANAQAMVRCSASATCASLNQFGAAKQLAMSAQAMEDAYMYSPDIDRERNTSGGATTSLARKALLYCMLREGNNCGALTLLRSVR